MDEKPLAAEDDGTRDMITEVLQDDEPEDDRGVRRTILDLIVWLEAEVARMEARVAAFEHEVEKQRNSVPVAVIETGNRLYCAVVKAEGQRDAEQIMRKKAEARIAELEALLARVRAPEHGSLTVKPDGDGDVARI